MAYSTKKDDLFINDSRFEIGMKLFNSCEWYKSHDVFEEIWHETIGPERQVLQGILQVAVAQVHLENGNINGATILFGEALGRLKRSQFDHLGLDIENLCRCVSKRLELLQTGKDLSNCNLPVLLFLR
tara:strand:+ start:360 stop:743 length:384 start_codon:yes stop_codon:yes gene_type:complete